MKRPDVIPQERVQCGHDNLEERTPDVEGAVEHERADRAGLEVALEIEVVVVEVPDRAEEVERGEGEERDGEEPREGGSPACAACRRLAGWGRGHGAKVIRAASGITTIREFGDRALRMSGSRVGTGGI